MQLSVSVCSYGIKETYSSRHRKGKAALKQTKEKLFISSSKALLTSNMLNMQLLCAPVSGPLNLSGFTSETSSSISSLS